MSRQPRHRIIWFLGLLLGTLGLPRALAASPENQVFQWSVSGENSAWPDGSKSGGTLYLWVPEACQRLRGLLVLGTNVPEHGLVNHPAIRQACAANDLGIVWSVPTFWRFGKVAPQPGAPAVDVKALPGSDRVQVEFHEHLLAELGEKSGYRECATVPWLPIGESGHLLMVAGLINQRPERCIAGICVKNPHPVANFSVPVLWTLGTGQEWGQMKVDVREHWLNVTDYPKWFGDAQRAQWPLSVVIEPGTGHFYCSDELADYFARYIGAACRARLPADGGNALVPIRFEAGVYADLPLPGQQDLALHPGTATDAARKPRPWFFNAELARSAQQFAEIDWHAAPQFAGFVTGDGCQLDPFSLNSVSQINVATAGEFAVRGELLSAIPPGFVGAGEPLARSAGEPVVEWICGPVAPAGPGRFRIALDRTWKTGAATYLVSRHPGDATARRTVQPARVNLQENRAGQPQRITFDAIADQPRGTTRVKLHAVSNAGLPVSFFVRAGPALVEGDELVFTAIPPRARLPLAVTVVAWQWGRPADPVVQTAALVEQTFQIVPPNSR